MVVVAIAAHSEADTHETVPIVAIPEGSVRLVQAEAELVVINTCGTDWSDTVTMIHELLLKQDIPKIEEIPVGNPSLVSVPVGNETE